MKNFALPVLVILLFTFTSCKKDDAKLLNQFAGETFSAKGGGGKNVDIADGLIAYFPFNGDAADESGNGYNGSVFGAELTKDRNNRPRKAFNFFSSYIYVTKLPVPLSGTYSISFWTNLNSYISGSVLFELNNGTACNGNPQLGMWNDEILLATCSNIYSSISLGSFNSMQNTWNHFAIEVNDKLTTVYRNGSLLTNKSITWPILIADNFTIGNMGNTASTLHSQPLDGKLDDIRIYNRVLNESEITYLANYKK